MTLREVQKDSPDPLDHWLASAQVHLPSEDVATETLEWIASDLRYLGDRVPPILSDSMPANDVVSSAAALRSVQMKSRLPMPMAAAACLVLFVLSTAVAVTETKPPRLGDPNGSGGVASLEYVLNDRSDRFVRLMLKPPDSPSKNAAILRRLRRSLEMTPAGRRQIGNAEDPLENTPLLDSDRWSQPIARSAILSVVQKHHDEIRQCYEDQLPSAPGLRTRIELGWEIEASGAVRNARVTEATPHWYPLEKCLVESVSRWRFPEPRGARVVEIRYPFVFRPIAK